MVNCLIKVVFVIAIEYIEIDKNFIPYTFEIQLDNITYAHEVHYNNEYDYFTIDLYKNDEAVVYGEKIVYGRPLFITYTYLQVPQIFILPYDLAENELRFNFDNVNKKTFLYIINGDVDG
jgi:hypothetical protein